MTRETYNSNTINFIQNANKTNNKMLNAIADGLKTNENNSNDLYGIVIKLQKENKILKEILNKIVKNESFTYIINNEIYKDFLRLDD